ncbi:Ig-like domain-containing protein, partial [Streptomyces murinus]
MNVRPISGASVARRRRAAGGLIAGSLVLSLAACGGGGGGGGKDDGKGAATQQGRPSTAAVSIAPEQGATGVATDGALKVSAARGKLTEVTVKDAKGAKVDGAITGDGGSWSPSAHLAA